MKTINISPEEKEVLKAICENSAEGLSIADIRLAIKTIDAIDESVGTLVLEDAYHNYLLERFTATKFVKADRKILALFDKLQ